MEISEVWLLIWRGNRSLCRLKNYCYDLPLQCDISYAFRRFFLHETNLQFFWTIKIMPFQTNYLSEFWGGFGRETDGASESEGHSPSTLTPTIATAPATLAQPSLQDPTLHQTDGSSSKEPLENSSVTVTIKDPRKDSGIRSRRSSIQTQVSKKSINCSDFWGSKFLFFTHCMLPPPISLSHISMKRITAISLL